MDLSNHRFEKFFHLSSDMLAITDRTGTFLRSNPAFRNILGWRESELENLSLWEIIVHEERLTIQNNFKNLAKGHPVLFAENKMLKRNGEIIPVRWTAYPDLTIGTVYLIGRSTNAELLENESFRMALDASPTGIVVIQSDGEINYTTPLMSDIFGYTENEMLGKKIEMLIPDNIRPKHIQYRDNFASDPYLRPMGMKSLNLWGKDKNGAAFPVDIGLNPVYTINGMVIIASVIDISERERNLDTLRDMIKNLQEDVLELDKLASIDDLTQLHNRRVLMKRAELDLYVAHKNRKLLSFAMLDIDDFKSYNDTFGHPAGDEVLRLVGQMLIEETRKDDLPARYGGEEFAIVMPDTTQEEACQVIERIRERIEKHLWKDRPITISTGMATFDASAIKKPSPELVPQFIIQADEALYKSKQDGKNRGTHFSDIPKQKFSSHKKTKHRS